MAAEALELKAKELGIEMKVEKDGSGGAKDVLTAAEIADADAVIVAAPAAISFVEIATLSKHVRLSYLAKTDTLSFMSK